MGREGSKQFFFEKKNQKTFAHWLPARGGFECHSELKWQKFFGSFFQKRTLLLAFAFSSTGASADPRQGLFRGQPVTYAERHGHAVFQGDMLLDHVSPLPDGTTRRLQPGVGIAYGQYFWPFNAQGVAQIPYIITSSADQLGAALTAYNTTFGGVIQFVQLGSQPDYVNFDFDQGNGSGQCESYVGRIGGEQTVGGSHTCSLGTLLHEFGHVTGLYHEMSRPDRNNFITFNTANVIKGSEDNFAILGDNYQDLGLFDYSSVMMYIPFAFTRNGGPVLDTIPAGMALSNLIGYTAGDIDTVRRLYGFAPTQVTVTSNPPGLSVVVDGNTITTPQSFSWALKSKHKVSVSGNAQTVGGGTYVYGRWNDSTAASHTITVAPGNNTLAQPNTSPAVTVYTANFIQLSPYSATIMPAGSGSVGTNPAPQSYPGANGEFYVARQKVTLTPTPIGAYQFIYFQGTSEPLSANPKPDYVPDGAAPYAVTAYFSTEPITTISTTPGGFYFTVDGDYYKSPQNFTADTFNNWGPNSTHILTGYSPNQPYSLNTRYLFNSWSDGGTLSHQITIPAGASAINGSFTAQYVPIAYQVPGCASTVSITPTSSDGFYSAGTTVTVDSKTVKGWKFNGWSGDLTGKKTSQKLVVNDEELAIATYNSSKTPYSLISLTPAMLPSGSAGGTVKIKGTGFTSNSAVFVNNIYRGSTYVSAKELDVALNSADLVAPGAFPIAVSNFPPNAPCGQYQGLGFFVTR
jgi:hypothetical protein